jgi:hypothetical protein
LIKLLLRGPKAGNEGDVVKHAALAAAAGVIAGCSFPAFVFADAFAGYGWNPLDRGTEWHRGIERLQDIEGIANEALRWYREHVIRPALAEGRYPGSSVIAAMRASSVGIPVDLHLWDTSERAATDLRASHETAVVENRAATSDEIAKLDAPLLLVDRPGLRCEQHPDWPDWSFLGQLLDATPSVMLWLPVSATGQDDDTAQRARDHELLATRVLYNNNGSTIGCRLLYRLPEDAVVALRSAVVDICRILRWKVTHSR